MFTKEKQGSLTAEFKGSILKISLNKSNIQLSELPGLQEDEQQRSQNQKINFDFTHNIRISIEQVHAIFCDFVENKENIEKLSSKKIAEKNDLKRITHSFFQFFKKGEQTIKNVKEFNDLINTSTREELERISSVIHPENHTFKNNNLCIKLPRTSNVLKEKICNLLTFFIENYDCDNNIKQQALIAAINYRGNHFSTYICEMFQFNNKPLYKNIGDLKKALLSVPKEELIKIKQDIVSRLNNPYEIIDNIAPSKKQKINSISKSLPKYPSFWQKENLSWEDYYIKINNDSSKNFVPKVIKQKLALFGLTTKILVNINFKEAENYFGSYFRRAISDPIEIKTSFITYNNLDEIFNFLLSTLRKNLPHLTEEEKEKLLLRDTALKLHTHVDEAKNLRAWYLSFNAENLDIELDLKKLMLQEESLKFKQADIEQPTIQSQSDRMEIAY